MEHTQKNIGCTCRLKKNHLSCTTAKEILQISMTKEQKTAMQIDAKILHRANAKFENGEDIVVS